MSAFVVDRRHIAYLVESAIFLDPIHGFRWRDKDDRSYHFLRNFLPTEQTPLASRIAQALWDENIRSVMYRHPDCTRDNLPGPINENFIYGIHQLDQFPEFTRMFRCFDPVQVIKSCHCYEYQSCEHPEWERSEAYNFVTELRDLACTMLPGYNEMAWGAPPTFVTVPVRVSNG